MMTIKGSPQVNIAIGNAFLRRIFPNPVKNWPKNCIFLRKWCQNIQVGPLSQAIRTAACISFGENISAKCVHLTSLYPMALTLTNDDFTVLHHVCTWCKIMQHLHVNFGRIWRFELVLCDTWNWNDDNDTVSVIAILDTTMIPEMHTAQCNFNVVQNSPVSEQTLSSSRL